MKEKVGERRSDEIHALLEAADPLRDEPSLSVPDVERIRHAVLDAERTAPSPMVFWPRAFAAAALVVLIAIAGVIGGRTKTGSARRGDATKVAAPAEPAERRQLQFATPGGTRIIWTLDPEFKLEGVAP
jgi:hypothetical protein